MVLCTSDEEVTEKVRGSYQMLMQVDRGDTSTEEATQCIPAWTWDRWSCCPADDQPQHKHRALATADYNDNNPHTMKEQSTQDDSITNTAQSTDRSQQTAYPGNGYNDATKRIL